MFKWLRDFFCPPPSGCTMGGECEWLPMLDNGKAIRLRLCIKCGEMR